MAQLTCVSTSFWRFTDKAIAVRRSGESSESSELAMSSWSCVPDRSTSLEASGRLVMEERKDGVTVAG